MLNYYAENYAGIINAGLATAIAKIKYSKNEGRYYVYSYMTHDWKHHTVNRMVKPYASI